MQVIPKPWGPSLLLAAFFCGWTPEYLWAQEGKAVGVEAQLRAVDFVGGNTTTRWSSGSTTTATRRARRTEPNA